MTELAPAESGQQYVFGFGSLVAAADRATALARGLTELAGFRRTWGVAMDNSVDLPRYKYFIDDAASARSGSVRPDVCVAFLDIEERPGCTVNGLLSPVGPGELERLDARERNYLRLDVTPHVPSPPGTVWAYVGRAEARERRARAAEQRRLIVVREYVEAVEEGFAVHGQVAIAKFRSSTEPHNFPVADLRQIDLA